ncbi:MAG: YccF domain-containing protein [Odoribacteraceae bacterium]|jgi:uncharacterized membrane protein YccF (DUF307 family)|nr:YccF domain-containing protein [Odoribacteraceae bacterium]
MKFLGNIIWLLFGGLAVAVEYFVSGVLLCLTIIGIPFGLQAFKLGALAIWPFGRESRRMQESNGCLSLFMNVLWFFIGGVWICLTHLLFGLLCCVTIIAIPWGMQHFKLAGLALAPFGREIR